MTIRFYVILNEVKPDRARPGDLCQIVNTIEIPLRLRRIGMTNDEL